MRDVYKRQVFYIGGNDSMDTIAKLSRYGERVGSSVRFIGCLLYTSRCV